MIDEGAAAQDAANYLLARYTQGRERSTLTLPSQPPEEPFPGRVRSGDGPWVPCRLVAFDLAANGGASAVSGDRDADGAFHLDRVGVPASPSPYDAFSHLRFESEGPVFPAGQAFAERIAAIIEYYGLGRPRPAPQPQPDCVITLDADTGALAESLHRAGEAALRASDAARGLADPVQEMQDATRYLLDWAMRGARARTSSSTLSPHGEPPAERIVPEDLNWPAQAAVCCHVCGPDPGHVCDARATTSITHPLPSGGKRTLPLCGPCAAVESAAADMTP